LADGEKPHPAIYWGCKRAEEEMQKNKSQGTPRTTTGMVFSFSLITPGMSFAVVLRGKTEEQQHPQTHQVAVVGPTIMETTVPEALPQHEWQKTGQSVQAPNVHSLPLDKMFKVVVTVLQNYERA
jgi:hypothetical protein